VLNPTTTAIILPTTSELEAEAHAALEAELGKPVHMAGLVHQVTHSLGFSLTIGHQDPVPGAHLEAGGAD